MSNVFLERAVLNTFQYIMLDIFKESFLKDIHLNAEVKKFNVSSGNIASVTLADGDTINARKSVIAAAWPGIARASTPPATAHWRMVLSAPPEKTCAPSAEKATAVTAALCPSNEMSCANFGSARFQTRAVLSAEAEASFVPSGLNARPEIAPSCPTRLQTTHATTTSSASTPRSAICHRATSPRAPRRKRVILLVVSGLGDGHLFLGRFPFPFAHAANGFVRPPFARGVNQRCRRTERHQGDADGDQQQTDGTATHGDTLAMGFWQVKNRGRNPRASRLTQPRYTTKTA